MFLPVSSIIGQFVLSIAITQYVSEAFSINERKPPRLLTACEM